VPIADTELANSSYLDFNSYRTSAASLSGGARATFNVGLVPGRATDPTSPLCADWASSQNQLAALNRNLSPEFYRVDDYAGMDAGLAPGGVAYAVAADRAPISSRAAARRPPGRATANTGRLSAPTSTSAT